MASELENAFPELREARYAITSPRDASYNCIAWAAEDDERWWWPAPHAYWPKGAPLRATLSAFVEAFRELGYEQCRDASLEAGWEKIAIYAKADGTPTHAARQLGDGTWTSKLGKDVDISHETLESLCGDHYGAPTVIMRRRKQVEERR